MSVKIYMVSMMTEFPFCNLDPKSGFCPDPDDAMVCESYEDFCYVDAHCQGSSKCCYDGCRNSCIMADLELIYTQGTT